MISSSGPSVRPTPRTLEADLLPHPNRPWPQPSISLYLLRRIARTALTLRLAFCSSVIRTPPSSASTVVDGTVVPPRLTLGGPVVSRVGRPEVAQCVVITARGPRLLIGLPDGRRRPSVSLREWVPSARSGGLTYYGRGVAQQRSGPDCSRMSVALIREYKSAALHPVLRPARVQHRFALP